MTTQAHTQARARATTRVATTKRRTALRAESWDLRDCDPLPAEELARLVQQYKATGCEESRNKIVESHLRLVAKSARRYSRTSVLFEDLMPEGAVALLRALDNFDPSRGVSFTSYASAVIDHTIRGTVSEARGALKLPARERRRKASRHRAESIFFIQHGRAPVPTELAEMHEPATLQIQPQVHGGEAVSLDAQFEDGTARTSTLADARPTPPEQLGVLEDVELMQQAMADLPAPESDMIAMRFGLNDQPRLSLAEIAQRLGKDAKRVERALAESLRRLRMVMLARTGAAA